MLRISDSIYIAFVFFFFFFNDTATTEIYTLPLHDALPIYSVVRTLLANGTTTAMYFGTIHAVGNQVLAERCLADRKSTRLNSSHLVISYAVFCLKKKKKTTIKTLCIEETILL